MRLSNFIKKEDENTKGVLNYEPKKIDMGIPTHAKMFTHEQPIENTERFKLDDLISQQTGIFESEKKRGEEEVNKRALDKLQEIQEKAYKEAYSLGMEEGTKKAFETHSERIVLQLEELNTLLSSIKEMKKELLIQNESHLVDLVYYCAEKIVMKEIEKTDSIVSQLIKSVVENLEEKENISIRLNDNDYQSIQNFLTEAQKEHDIYKKIKFYPNPDFQKGGCIVETDHGLVDATLEERFKKLWDILNGHKPAKIG